MSRWNVNSLWEIAYFILQYSRTLIIRTPLGEVPHQGVRIRRNVWIRRHSFMHVHIYTHMYTYTRIVHIILLHFSMTPQLIHVHVMLFIDTYNLILVFLCMNILWVRMSKNFMRCSCVVSCTVLVTFYLLEKFVILGCWSVDTLFLQARERICLKTATFSGVASCWCSSQVMHFSNISAAAACETRGRSTISASSSSSLREMNTRQQQGNKRPHRTWHVRAWYAKNAYIAAAGSHFLRLPAHTVHDIAVPDNRSSGYLAFG